MDMDTKNEWIPITKDLDFGRDSTSISCDTRVFRAIIHNTPIKLIEDDDRYYLPFNEVFSKIINNDSFDEKYLISYEEIIPFILKVKEIRDKAETIVMSFDVENCKFWLKYIRFYKLTNGKYVVTNDGRPFEWRKISYETLDDFYKNK